MGEVYLGEKIGPEGFVKPVVLKCVLPQLAKDRAFVQLFLDEARLAALLNHPNIAQVYDFGVADDIYYMAMEYVPGYTVDDIRRKHKAIDKFMPIEHVACVASQACQGLQYAHTLTDARNVSLGLVHRDVSPHNLIVSVDGGVKIVDFGIAKARAGLTRVQAKGAVGKFGYMSPEQSRGEQVDARTDVFSLGVCIWELLANRRLHDAKIDRPPDYDPDKPVPSVTAFRRDVPKQFDKLIRSALAVEPDVRFASCQEMHIELERFMAAMTHYAGHSALADYIKQLVEGKVENPPETSTGGLVEPATIVAAGPRGAKAPQPGGLEVAQRYEEVFGTAVEEAVAAAEPELKRVPDSWKARPRSAPPRPAASRSPSPAPSRPPRAGRRPAHDEDEIELHTGRTPKPEVERRRQNDEERKRRLANAPPAPTRRASKGPVISLMALILLVVVAAGGWFFHDEIFAAADKLRPKPPDAPTIGSAYRIVSKPAGGVVYLDGQRKGVTPLVLELIPDVRYLIEVKKANYATKRLMLDASVGEGTREQSFELRKPATLRVTSKPKGATVAINGILLKGVLTPARLTDVAGGVKLRVTVEKAPSPPVTREVKVAVGRTKKAHFNLEGQ